jgi:chromosome segregation ATPase
MHIQEVVIEGFKSYAQRTVIQGWDPQFNAITGLNGTGKSNILDAICFVLGISNLSQVRAGNLQDLVYKQGQAGVTKASVTIVFNNSDPLQSPIGYEHHETISVCRQVRATGGERTAEELQGSRAPRARPSESAPRSCAHIGFFMFIVSVRCAHVPPNPL